MTKVNIPMPLLLVIDDVGWWLGQDGSSYNEPYRTGITRNHSIEDYQAIIDLGKKLDMRIQAGLVLCEWDRKNILKDVPGATWQGNDWSTSINHNKLDEVVELLNANSQHIELCLHALAHEFWDNGKMVRAEWANMAGMMRPIEIVKAHLDAFFNIMEHNGLNSNIVSYIPAAFRHCFAADKSMAAILKDYGLKFISTEFEGMANADLLPHKLFGIDNGLPTISRGQSEVPWFGLNPAIDDKVFPGPICGIHWPNILHSDPRKNSEVIDNWSRNLISQAQRFNLILAHDIKECWTQLAHQCLTTVSCSQNEIHFDFSTLNNMNLPELNDYFYIKITSDQPISNQLEVIKQDGNVYTLKIMHKTEKRGTILL